MDFIDVSKLAVLVAFLSYTSANQVFISRGSDIVLNLPGKECGQYTLLNGLLRPVLVIEKGEPKLLGRYAQRANITSNETGFTLTINEAGLQDDGRYKVASSRTGCKDIEYFVTVKAALTQEFLEQWGEWTPCVKDCDAKESRSRSRNCSVNGGCEDMGPMDETQACDQADHCAHWSQWSGFGECSAKCGKGFKIRSRICLKGSSSLLQTGDCEGLSMQSHMCMTVCEVVGVWTGWTGWSDCTTDCGETRHRNRTRLCNDPRETPNCPGNYTEYEDCPLIHCREFQNTTGNETTGTNGTLPGNQITETEVTLQAWLSELNLVVMLVILGVITLIVLIVIFMFVKRRLEVKRVNSTRLARDTQVENATIDKRLTKAAKRASKPDGVNVYSELGSSFCYNDSEFDDTEDEEDDKNKPEDSKSSTSASGSREEKENKFNDAIVGDGVVTSVNSVKNDRNIYDNNTDVSEISESVLCNMSDDGIYSNPPDEEDRADEVDLDKVFVESNVNGTEDDKDGGQKDFKELTGLFVLPPVKKLSTGFDVSEMYRKVNKNRIKPNKVEINHDHDVYYDPPPEYTGQSDDVEPEVESKPEPEINNDDNVYENCEVSNGQTDIVPVKADIVHSKSKKAKRNNSKKDKTEKPKEKKTDKTKDSKSEKETEMHPKLKEALRDKDGMFFVYDKEAESLKDIEAKEDVQTEEGEHIYVNSEITRDIKDYYVIPKYRTENKHIYDVPRSPP